MSKKIRLEDIPLGIEETDAAGNSECGFRRGWMDADGKGFTATMYAGAGLENPWLIITLNDNGKMRYFRADMQKFTHNFLSLVLNRKIIEKK